MQASKRTLSGLNPLLLRWNFQIQSQGKAANLMATQSWQKMYFSSFVSDLLSSTTDQDAFSFLLFYKSRSNKTHIEALIGKQISTKCRAFFSFFELKLTWRWNAGNLETTSWSFQWANFGRAAWFSWSSCSECSCYCSSCCSSTAGSRFTGARKSQIKHEPGLDFWKVSFDQLDWGFCDSGCFFNPREKSLDPIQPPRAQRLSDN